MLIITKILNGYSNLEGGSDVIIERNYLTIRHHFHKYIG